MKSQSPMKFGSRGALAVLLGVWMMTTASVLSDDGVVSGETAKLSMALPADYRPATASTNVVVLKPGRSVPGVSSMALIQKAWRLFETKKYDEAILIVDECAVRFGALAHKQQSLLKGFAPPEKALNYSALNDVATGLFIKGRALRESGHPEEAKDLFKQILREYRYAQCWDPKGWFWKVADAAQDQLYSLEFQVDFGDYTSATLTLKAWKAYLARQYTAVELYTRRCIELYGATADSMQMSLRGFAPKGQESDYWALNDVATCLFIRGKSLQRQGKDKEASLAFKTIKEKYAYAQCWDPNGWYWKVAEESRRYF